MSDELGVTKVTRVLGVGTIRKEVPAFLPVRQAGAGMTVCKHEQTKMVEDSCYRGKIEQKVCLACGEVMDLKIVR